MHRLSGCEKGSSCDRPGGQGHQAMLARRLADRQCESDEVDTIFADGTSLPREFYQTITQNLPDQWLGAKNRLLAIGFLAGVGFAVLVLPVLLLAGVLQ